MLEKVLVKPRMSGREGKRSTNSFTHLFILPVCVSASNVSWTVLFAIGKTKMNQIVLTLRSS